MKIGLRTVKTGIAIMLTMLVASLLEIEYPFFAMIAAFIAIQPTVADSWRVGINRMLGTLLGAGIGLFFALNLPVNFIFGGIGTILVIYIMNRLHWNEAINIAVVVFMAIFLNLSTGHVSYAFHRLTDTFIGIAVAVVVNYLIYPPNYDLQASQRLRKISGVIWEAHIEALERLLYPTENPRFILDHEIEEMEHGFAETEKYIKLMEKDDKVRVYGRQSKREMALMITLSKEIFQHLLTVQGVLEKGIHPALLMGIFKELQFVKEEMKKFKDPDQGMINEALAFDFKPSLEVIQHAKKRIKTSEEIHQYPTDEVIKILVVFYNIEESLSKFKIMMNLIE